VLDRLALEVLIIVLSWFFDGVTHTWY
jgi:hypothetical protein